MPKLPNIAEIVLFSPNCLHKSFSIWILWQLSILAIVVSSHMARYFNLLNNL